MLELWELLYNVRFGRPLIEKSYYYNGPCGLSLVQSLEAA